MEKLTYVQALNKAIHLEMAEDDQVIIMGLDVDDHKAIYQSLDGILAKYGPQRIFNTPLSEEGMTGFAIGAALAGKKVVHTHIRADFCLLAFNQIINMASNISYISNGALSVPLTIRCIVGRGWGQGPQHSKSIHSMLAQIPGLKVYSPSRPQDIFSCMRAAIQDPNPCVILEHRWLFDVSGEVDFNRGYEPASRLIEGQDITIVSTSWMSVEALQVAEALKNSNISCEVIDISGISPLGFALILESVKKTGRLLVCDYDWAEFGFAAEVIAYVVERQLSSLKSPPKRLGFAHTPCPTARVMESDFYPSTQDLADKVTEALGRAAHRIEGLGFQSYENRFKGPF